MRIKSNDIIAGKPVLAIRKLLRYRAGSIDTVMDMLATDEEEARKIYLELCEEGYIQPSSDTFDENIEQWHNTLKGSNHRGRRTASGKFRVYSLASSEARSGT